jgi:hypothetical protein
LGLPLPLLIAITIAQTYEKDNIWRVRIIEEIENLNRLLDYIIKKTVTYPIERCNEEKIKNYKVIKIK